MHRGAVHAGRIRHGRLRAEVGIAWTLKVATTTDSYGTTTDPRSSTKACPGLGADFGADKPDM